MIATSRSGPTGSAQTTASAAISSPQRSVTVQLGFATSIASTTHPSLTRSPSSSAIRSATVAEPSATRRCSQRRSS